MLSKRLALSALASSLMLCTSFALFAQETVILPKDRSNFTLEAVTDVPMRRRPPNYGYIFISSPEESLALIKKGEKVKMRGKKVIRTFFGDDTWIKVRQTEQGKKAEGWVYFGSGDTSLYFRLATTEGE